MGKKLSDWPSHTIAKDHVKHPEAHFTEKKLIDYHVSPLRHACSLATSLTLVSSRTIITRHLQWFDAKRIEPRFEFGFGMSYTTFKFGDVTIEETFEADNSSIQPTAEKFDKSTGQGDSVYDTMLTITTEVTNSGDVQGAEVAQLYLSVRAALHRVKSCVQGLTVSSRLTVLHRSPNGRQASPRVCCEASTSCTWHQARPSLRRSN